jgi:branched-chain amino acid transport system permease protein
MSVRLIIGALTAVAGVVMLAFVPSVTNGYQLSLAINIMNYTVLATAWALFSGPTRYVSLATVAFFGIGAYTVAVLGEELAWPLVLLIAFAIGFVLSLVGPSSCASW